MASVHPVILIVIGVVVTFVSWINPEARSKLMIFFWIGIGLLVWGIIQLVLRKRAKAAQKQNSTQQTQEAQRVYQQYQQQAQQRTHPTWQHTQQDFFRPPQHQGYAQVQQTQSQAHSGQVACPNCGKPKYAGYRFCPYCGYGV